MYNYLILIYQLTNTNINKQDYLEYSNLLSKEI